LLFLIFFAIFTLKKLMICAFFRNIEKQFCQNQPYS